jgi:hypothetical protein
VPKKSVSIQAMTCEIITDFCHIHFWGVLHNFIVHIIVKERRFCQYCCLRSGYYYVGVSFDSLRNFLPAILVQIALVQLVIFQLTPRCITLSTCF